MKDLKDVFEKAISRQEQRILCNAFMFDDESQDDFYARKSRQIMHITVPYLARDLPGIEGICQGLNANWQGFYIQRRRVDQLDNVYVSRLHQLDSKKG